MRGSGLLKLEGAFRFLQLVAGLLVTVFWVWMRTQGFGQTWDTAPPGAGTYGTILFIVGVLAGGSTLANAVGSCFFVHRSHYGDHGGCFRASRVLLELLLLGLWVVLRLLINITPARFLPDLLEPSNPATARTFFQVYNITSAGIGVMIVLVGLTVIIVLVEAWRGRNGGPPNSRAFDKLDDGNPAISEPYPQQNFSRPPYGGPQPTYESNVAAMPPTQPNYRPTLPPLNTSPNYETNVYHAPPSPAYPGQPSAYPLPPRTPTAYGHRTQPSYSSGYGHRAQPSQASSGYAPSGYGPSRTPVPPSPSVYRPYTAGGNPRISAPFIQSGNRF